MCLYDDYMCLLSLFKISKFMKSTYDDDLILVWIKISFIHIDLGCLWILNTM